MQKVTRRKVSASASSTVFPDDDVPSLNCCVPVFMAATLACTIAAQGNGPGFLSKQFFAYNGRCCSGLKAINSGARMDSNSPGSIASRRPSTSKLLRTRRYCALSVKSHAPL